MPSQLSSLLVRDGLTTPKRIERALMQQVVRGGSLDTVLLEMGAVAEDRLTQYLSLATGLPPASKTETDVFDGEAVKACPRELGDRYRVAPLELADSTLKVIVCEPVDRAALQQLADDVGLALQPLVVPEYRFNVIFSRVYDSEASERFEQLALRQQGVTFAAMGGAETVILESQADIEDHIVVDTPLEPETRSTQEFSSDAVAERIAREAAADEQPAIADMETQPVERVERDTVEQPAQAEPEPQAAAEPEPQAAAEPEPQADEPELQADEPELPAGTGPITLDQARAALHASEDRDEIFELLLRGLRSVARYAALLTIQKKQASGRHCLHDGSFPDDIKSVQIPLAESSVFKNAAASGAPFIGPIRAGSEEINKLITKLGGDLASSALVLPIKLRGRVVALAIAHSGADSSWVAKASTSFILATETAEAIERLLLAKSKPSAGGDDDDADGQGSSRKSKKKPHGKRKRSKTNAEDAAR